MADNEASNKVNICLQERNIVYLKCVVARMLMWYLRQYHYNEVIIIILVNHIFNASFNELSPDLPSFVGCFYITCRNISIRKKLLNIWLEGGTGGNYLTSSLTFHKVQGWESIVIVNTFSFWVFGGHVRIRFAEPKKVVSLCIKRKCVVDV